MWGKRQMNKYINKCIMVTFLWWDTDVGRVFTLFNIIWFFYLFLDPRLVLIRINKLNLGPSIKPWQKVKLFKSPDTHKQLCHHEHVLNSLCVRYESHHQCICVWMSEPSVLSQSKGHIRKVCQWTARMKVKEMDSVLFEGSTESTCYSALQTNLFLNLWEALLTNCLSHWIHEGRP